MVLADVNVLVNAFRSDAPEHKVCREWLDDVSGGDARFGISTSVLSGVIRVVTHRKIFEDPNTTREALEYCSALIDQPHSIVLHPGRRHWKIFRRLCLEAEAKGNLVPDAWHAALAIEHGCRWITLDRDFARFAALDWATP